MTENKKRVAFKTLGCRLNQFETGSLATQFKNAGYNLVGFNDPADVYIVNTCTVTNQSDHKSRNIISQAERRGEEPVIVVTGCMAESSREKLLEDKKITYVVGNDSKSDIFSVVDAHFHGEVFHLQHERKVFDFQNPEKIYKTRGTIKIQDGCNNFCTFCIIPFVRGRAISRPIDKITENARRLVDNGYHEIVVTGVNIGRYKYEDYLFEDVIEKLLDIPGDFRLRISSMEPEGIGDKFLELINHPKMTPHLHLCLQSGSDEILKKMHRMYDISQYMALVEKIRKISPQFNFTTDVMVGFPGEMDKDFEDTCNIVQEVGFGHIHTFKYSLRSGTRAERMDGHLPEKVKNERSKLIRQIGDEEKIKYRKQFLGKEQLVLVETKKRNGMLTGYGENYIPVACMGDSSILDSFRKVKITEVSNNDENQVLGELA